MADSPKCIPCLKLGRTAQTYKMAGTHYFRCHDCEKHYSRDSFEPIELQWNEPDKKDEWKQFMEKNGVKFGAEIVS